MTSNCEYCGNSFEKRRKDARFCNSTCRSKANKEGLGNPGFNSNPFSDYPKVSMNSTGNNDFLGYIRAENITLKEKINQLTAANATLLNENLNLKTEAKINEKLNELNQAQSAAEKDRGLSGVIDTIGSNDRWMDIIESLGSSLVDKLGPGGKEPSILQGMDDSQKQHIEVLINNIKGDPEFTKKITAIALKTKADPDILDEIIQYLQSPQPVNGTEDEPEETIEPPVVSQSGFGLSIFGSA